MSPRNPVDTWLVQRCAAAANHQGERVRRFDRIADCLVALAIGAALGWWLWEWAGQCVEALTCGAALARPHLQSAQSINQERLHSAIDDAYKSGDADGYLRGYRSGMRASRVLHVGAGTVIGAVLVMAALQLGWLVGGAA